MKKPTFEIDPTARKFILKVINTDEGYEALAKKSFIDIVKYAKSKGYKITDVKLLSTLSHYYQNEFPLPYWMESKLGSSRPKHC